MVRGKNNGRALFTYASGRVEEQMWDMDEKVS